jgi:hypothetical protein
MSKLFVNTIAPNSGDTVTLSGSLVTTGKLTIGDASTDTVAFEAEISSSLIPDVGATYALGTMANSWGSLHVHGLGHIHTASINVVSSSLLPDATLTYNLGSPTRYWSTASIRDIRANDIQSIYIGNTTQAISFGYFNVLSAAQLSGKGTAAGGIISMSADLHPNTTATVDLGHMGRAFRNLHAHGIGHIHTASINVVSSSLIPDADDTFDLGSSAKQWKDLYVDGIAYIDTIASPLNVNTLSGTSIDTTHITASNLTASSLIATHITASSLIVSGINLHSSVLAPVDSTHLGSVDGFSKFSVQGQLQAALADGATSAEFTVGNTDIALGDVIFGNVHGVLMGGLSQSNMIIATRTANSMSFVFNNESGLVAADDTPFTASFAIIK